MGEDLVPSNGNGKRPRRVGRPTKLNPEKQETILQLVRNGNYLSTAAAYVGVDEVTLHRWLQKGEDENGPEDHEIYRQFRQAVQRARAEAEARDIAKIELAADNGDWRASAWRVARAHPDRWSEHQVIDGGKPVQLQVGPISPEELRATAVALLEE